MKDLDVFTTVSSLQKRLSSLRGMGEVGFVPTMGALHHGHLSLVKQALERAETVVVSIFVNPTQFNNTQDLKKYPRTLKEDVRLLQSAGDVLVFAPDVKEVYPPDFKEIDLELGGLEKVMEGAFRPGHFKGVVNVVKRLFDIVQPNFAVFGMKDFQQLSVIQYMVRELVLPIEIVPAETVREVSGLASSSRNRRLSDAEAKDAEIIFQTMDYARSLVKSHTPKEVTDLAKENMKDSPLKLEYLEIVDPFSLETLENWVPGARICIAAFCGQVRLIDNSELINNSANS